MAVYQILVCYFTAHEHLYMDYKNREFIQEEQLRIAEELLQKVAEIGRAHGISLGQMTNILKLFYEE